VQGKPERGEVPPSLPYTQEVVKMRRIRLVVAAAATMLAMLTFSVPAMADVDFDSDRHEDRYDKYEDRYDRYEDRIDEYEDRIDDHYDALEEAYEDGLFYYNSFGVYDIDDIEDIEDIEDHWDLD
jgi:hypothetical protein